MRQQLLDAVGDAGRENSTATVHFHNAIAERAGLGPTDHKTLDVLLRLGPLTAGEIGAHTGLTSASVTSLIDRLEARGFARRVRDAADRRRVIVEPVPERLGVFAALIGPFVGHLDGLLASYTDAQLETIRDFLVQSAALLREHTERLRNP